MIKSIAVSLPWPPTANTYWRRCGHVIYLSPKAVAYRKEVIIKCLSYKNYFINGERLSLEIHAYPPDKRKRDLDNLCKCIGDSLQHAQVYDDDNQIDELIIRRMPEIIGKVNIFIKEII